MLVDSYEYFQLSENILNYFEFYSSDLNAEIQFENYTKRPPLYSIFLLIFSFLLHSTVTVLIVQNILSIISISIMILMFKSYYPQLNKTILILFFITGINQFIYANLIMSEIFFQFLIVLLCYNLHQFIKRKNIQSLVYFQILIVLLFLTKPVFYLIIIPNIILGIILTRHLKFAYLSSLIPIIAFLLYCNWNYHRTGSYDFSSIQNINLKNYNLKYFHINKYGEEYAIEVNNEITAKSKSQTSYLEKEKEVRNSSLEYIKKDFWSYIIFQFKGSLRGFADPGRFDLYNFFEFESTKDVGLLRHINLNGVKGVFEYLKSQPLLILIIIPIILIFNLIKGLGFILFWLKYYKKASLIFWVMLFIILYIAILTGPLASSRFFLPFSTIYLLYASVGLSDLFSKRKLFKKIIS